MLGCFEFVAVGLFQVRLGLVVLGCLKLG